VSVGPVLVNVTSEAELLQLILNTLGLSGLTEQLGALGSIPSSILGQIGKTLNLGSPVTQAACVQIPILGTLPGCETIKSSSAASASSATATSASASGTSSGTGTATGTGTSTGTGAGTTAAASNTRGNSPLGAVGNALGLGGKSGSTNSTSA
jgi:hypothetical protein